MKNIQVLANKVLELVSEIETYSFYKENLVRTLERLFDEYQKGRFTYFEYEQTVKRMLKGRSKEEWINYYNSYILYLMKRIEAYNSQIFYEAYSNQEYVGMRVAKAVPAVRPVAKPAVKPEYRRVPQVKPKHAPPVEIPAAEEKRPEAIAEAMPEAAPAIAEEAAVPEVRLVEIKPSVMDRISLFFRHVFAKKEVEERLEEIKAARPLPEIEPEKRLPKLPLKAPAPERPAKPARPARAVGVRKRWFSFLWGAPKPTTPIDEAAKKPIITVVKKPEKPGIEFGKLFGIDYLTNLLSRRKGVEFTEKSPEVPMSTIQLETLRRKAKPEISAQIEKITATALTKEATRIRSIMEKRKALKIYQPSFFGSLANIAIKKISLFLLDQFPDFFKDLYHALRLANIKVLSNTYVNMMVLGVLSSTLMGLLLFGMFFSVTPLPLSQVFFRTLMMGLLTGLAAFAGFYAYPYSKMKQRRRSINTNLPFAINHMAAVSSSGVAPVRMFRLISESREYGEVSVEIEKIVNYVDIFGYDILTALKAVAATTPSYHFKDFLEGMVSTTQTGGDIKAYFSQKAEEAMLNYTLERQKYTETISTYSDIYTGILIAAPLFFVAALSMVSLLGGKIGGMNVNVVIVIGTYVIIPFLNVSFLTFLELTQPEI
ncbi:type II secretion system F family protein [Candidatus Woesearchaeota archaeon]|nr:type II secretion system F family protein [Candidatus Woesearchaeota archaeon]